MDDINPGASGSEVGPVKDELPTETLGHPQSTRSEEEPAPSGSAFLLNEIEALKEKLLRLEQMAIDSRAAGKEDPSQPRHPSDVGLDQLHASQVAELEEYGRREQCLYGHRKEFEAGGGPGNWRFYAKAAIYRSDNHDLARPIEMFTPKKYKRPDPFDPSHQCSVSPGIFAPDSPDIFDQSIDFGARRERLRQNFEWDLDRTFLVEETQKRMREKEADAEAERRRAEAVAKAAGLGSGKKSTNPSKGTDSGSGARATKSASIESLTSETIPESQLNRLDWLAFRSKPLVAQDGPCYIDVLVGEPAIANTQDSWYSFSPESVRKAPDTGNQLNHDLPNSGNRPVPERIRIYSPLLQSILSEVLGHPMVAGKNSEFVLLRPFKALVYREEVLRDWLSALERKFRGAKREIHTAQTSRTVDAEMKVQSELEKGVTKPLTAVDDSVSPQIQDPTTEPTTKSSDKDHNEIRKTDQKKMGDDDEGEVEETQSEGAMDHLRILLQFIDSEIVPRRRHLESSSCKKVEFSDLWYLFRPGLEVIGNDGKQVYRVVKVSSARHRVVPTWEMYWSGDKEKDKKKKQPPFSIKCVFVDFNGKSLGPVSTAFNFPRFIGEREVTSFAVYPLRFHPHRRSDFSDSEWRAVSRLPEDQRLKAKLVLRGQKFLEVANVKQMYYAGPTIDVRDEVESQVVVDFETAFSTEDRKDWKPQLELLMGSQDDENDDKRPCNAACCMGQNVHDDQYVDESQMTEYINHLFPHIPGVDIQPSVAIIPRSLDEVQTGQDPGTSCGIPDEDLLIMSYRVFAFVLRSRKWAQLDLTYMTDLYTPDPEDVGTAAMEPPSVERAADDSNRKTAFDQLVLEKGYKKMILSLTAQHFRDKESAVGATKQVDIVKGKGKGLIILLHGAPGVGKTSTAEGVAEVFKRPLFQITCGDLGTTAKEVEAALETNFTLANKWGCILLLDEADVFLAQRTKEDFVRNGLVAVFLRVMEYYSGVLFLTTNRVGDFDEAFTSRIHVSLYYPELDQKKTRDVFQINLNMIKDRFKKAKREILMDHFEIGGFATEHSVQAKWNGRQIRNACQTALALAEYEAQGSSYNQILKPDRPDAVVELKVKHFEEVQKAYMEFTKYIDELYGSSANRRAKEHKIRALIDGDGNIFSVVAHKEAFGATANAQSPAPAPAQGSFPQAYQTAPGYQQPPIGTAMQPGYYAQSAGVANSYNPQGQQQQYPGNMAFNPAMMGNNMPPNAGGTQNAGTQQHPRAQQSEHNQQQPWMTTQSQGMHMPGQPVGGYQTPSGTGSGDGFSAEHLKAGDGQGGCAETRSRSSLEMLFLGGFSELPPPMRTHFGPMSTQCPLKYRVSPNAGGSNILLLLCAAANIHLRRLLCTITMPNATRVRLSHKKSRNGCRECKRRHVKCDEKRPICTGCDATNRRCSFLDLHPIRPPSPSPRAATASSLAASSFATPSSCSASPDPSSHDVFTPTTDVADSGVVPRNPDPAPQRPLPVFDMRHLVLLHHLETHALRPSSVLSWIGTDTAKMFSETVFESAVSSPYLMHELLAFSALHLSTQQSEATEKAKFLHQAAELQTSALALFNAVKHDVRNENCMALFLFSSLLGMHTLFDAVTSCTDFGGLLEKTVHYLKLHRGVSSVTSQSWHVLRNSELRVIIDAIEAGDQLYRHRFGHTDNECDKLSSLVQQFSDRLGPGPYKACQEAVQVLQWTFGVRRTVAEPYPTHVILAWPIRVSAEFVDLLEQRQPIPLIILAHWAVLLHYDRNFWVFGNGGRDMIKPLLAYLGSYWDDWLELPRSVLGQE